MPTARSRPDLRRRPLVASWLARCRIARPRALEPRIEPGWNVAGQLLPVARDPVRRGAQRRRMFESGPEERTALVVPGESHERHQAIEWGSLDALEHALPEVDEEAREGEVARLVELAHPRMIPLGKEDDRHEPGFGLGEL